MHDFLSSFGPPAPPPPSTLVPWSLHVGSCRCSLSQAARSGRLTVDPHRHGERKRGSWSGAPWASSIASGWTPRRVAARDIVDLQWVAPCISSYGRMHTHAVSFEHAAVAAQCWPDDVKGKEA